MSLSAAALAGEPVRTPPQEPVGFVTGAVIGGFAAGPLGAVIGAGIGTWLGNRVHRAGEAGRAEASLTSAQSEKAELQADKFALQAERDALVAATGDLSQTNKALTARLDQLSHSVELAQGQDDAAVRGEAAKVLDGLQGDVLFRTGSAEIPPDVGQGIRVLAEAVAKNPALKVRLDGYTDPRGSDDANLKLSEQRADAVRDLFLSAGVNDTALEINAYGRSQSVAADSDGFALERRVRLTLESRESAAVVGSAGAADAPPAAVAAVKPLQPAGGSE